MTIQEQIDEIKKELSGITGQLEKKINQLQKQVIIKGLDNKPTRYYPNGAYMDEPEEDAEIWFIEGNAAYLATWSRKLYDVNGLLDMRHFPTREAAQKELKRRKLTAKMYRDMRGKSINGDWILLPESYKHSPYMGVEKRLDFWSGVYLALPHNFYYKNETFIEDLEALGWTEEDLKLVWFII